MRLHGSVLRHLGSRRSLYKVLCMRWLFCCKAVPLLPWTIPNLKLMPWAQVSVKESESPVDPRNKFSVGAISSYAFSVSESGVQSLATQEAMGQQGTLYIDLNHKWRLWLALGALGHWTNARSHWQDSHMLGGSYNIPTIHNVGGSWPLAAFNFIHGALVYRWDTGQKGKFHVTQQGDNTYAHSSSGSQVSSGSIELRISVSK